MDEGDTVVPHWTVETYAIHNEALRGAEEKFQAERDRRYSELEVEREKALAIKEKADLAALQLARDIQTYKDEKANELRSQIERERGSYASKDDLRASVEKIEETLKPIVAFVSAQQGRAQGGFDSRTAMYATIGLIVTIGVALMGLVTFVITNTGP